MDTPTLPNPRVLYEDPELVIVNKPAGLVVNRAETVKEATIQDWAEKKLRIKNSELRSEDDFYLRAGIVHRLDKETSGCLVIAKTPEAFAKLQLDFKERQVKKTYLALVHGLIPKTGDVNAPVGRLPWNRERFGIVPGGKPSRTTFQVEATYTRDGKQFSLVEITPETGRTHQIRVHLKYLGYPIVGDYLYGGRKQQLADRIWCPRVFLHAQGLSFPHPSTGRTVEVTAPLPEDLTQILSTLERAYG